MGRNNRTTTAANKAGDVLDAHPGPVTPGVLLNTLESAFPKQAATAANATDLATAITLANGLKAQLQALGLIA
jgi:hypothetical protein